MPLALPSIGYTELIQESSMVRSLTAPSAFDAGRWQPAPPSPPKEELCGALATLVARLRALQGSPSAEEILDAVSRTAVTADAVSSFIAPTGVGYGRRRIVRTAQFEVLVMSFRPGQRTGPHDHGGAISVFRILAGKACETRYRQRADALVEPVGERSLEAGDIGSDAGELIHEIRNDAANDTLLVSLHVYCPPLPELRRFAPARSGTPVPGPFLRAPTSGAQVLGVIGGGYSGTMVLAQLARRRRADARPLHILWFDRQTALGEGAAYRTPDRSHLLNVPASNMSAWSDRPSDFLDWCARRESPVPPYSFLSRQIYGEYLRETLLAAVAGSAPGLSVKWHRGDVVSMDRKEPGGWRLRCADGGTFDADLVVLATGHRAPD